jgi:hypothetical protein
VNWYSDRLWAGQLRNWGSIPGRGKRFSLLCSIQTSSKSQPASCSTGAVSQENMVVAEADHSPLSSAQVKNGGVITPLPMCFHSIALN